jgi:hypothetical protein
MGYANDHDEARDATQMLIGAFGFLVLVLLALVLVFGWVTEKDKCDPANVDYSWWVSEGVCAP